MFKLAVDVALECISSSSSDDASGDDGDCPASLLPLQMYIFFKMYHFFPPNSPPVNKFLSLGYF